MQTGVTTGTAQRIGVPREIFPGEKRVATVPEVVEKLIKLGFFKDLAALKDYTGRLDALVAEPDRKDFRWQLGIDEDIMDDGIRELEFANWVKHFFG